MKFQRGYTLTDWILTVFMLFCGIGYVWNIIKIAATSFDVITTMLVFRFIGILVPPLGTVLGYF